MKVLKKSEHHIKWFHGKIVECQQCKSQMELSSDDTPKRYAYDVMAGNTATFNCPVCGREIYICSEITQFI